MNILEIKNLSKRFGEIQAVNDISFSVKKGELFAFLGVNGAGKSTTISMVCGRLTPDSGEIFIDGEKQKADDLSLKKKIGVVFQSSVLDKTLTVYDNLSLRAALYGITGEAFKKRLEELDELLGVKEILKRPVGKLSGGQRRRADIARALLHAPKILILDEPTTGLDPQTRKTVWNAVDKMRKQNALTVLLTTHYMEEAALADKIYVMDQGEIVMSGTPREVFSRAEELRKLRLTVPQVTELSERLKKAGVDLPDGILEISELVEALLAFASKNNKGNQIPEEV